MINSPSATTTKTNCSQGEPMSQSTNIVPLNKVGRLPEQHTTCATRVKVTALYERLSREGEDTAGESNSINNQKQLLADYCKQHGFRNAQHYTDDGMTGTRFDDRESWQRLIADVESGLVDTIICKDMSRIGRDHVQVGMYLEIFRRKEVRFIAINNSVDSNDQSTLEFAPFINIMNEWYACVNQGATFIFQKYHAK